MHLENPALIAFSHHYVRFLGRLLSTYAFSHSLRGWTSFQMQIANLAPPQGLIFKIQHCTFRQANMLSTKNTISTRITSRNNK